MPAGTFMSASKPERNLSGLQRWTLTESPAESSATVRFLPNGSSDTVEILLQSRNGSLLRVVSDPISGGVCIRPGEETL